MNARLAIFDLDHTLLSGDTDVLWCAFLIARGVLDGATFAARSAELERRYRAGTVGTREFAGFYASTLAGRAPGEWEAERRLFLEQEIAPRLPAAARALVERHRAEGAELLMSTATSRFLTERTAAHLRIAELLATELELRDGRLSGELLGEPNMREHKVTRLHAWLAERGRDRGELRSAVAYSDSINDLPLLSAVGHPVAVDPDERLRAHAQAQGWPIISLRE